MDRNGDYSDYLTIIKFAVENISKVKSVDGIISCFQNSIEDITDRDELHMAQLISMNIPGHENYLFKFKENCSSFGEFSVDFIPTNPEEFTRNGIRALGGLTTEPLFDQKQLANFRVQLFADGLLSFTKLRCKVIFDYIIKQFGEPNQSPIAKEHAKFLEETCGTEINCWHFQKEEKDYLITFYFFRDPNNIRSYASFSISLVFQNKDRY
ncbi:MAG: hypothetical protein Q7S45_04635 [Candidatus Curtissbacteria bacterium]|nr:hypothetical protein [Candidatus Curtissbacteria bacterium]